MSNVSLTEIGTRADDTTLTGSDSGPERTQPSEKRRVRHPSSFIRDPKKLWCNAFVREPNWGRAKMRLLRLGHPPSPPRNQLEALRGDRKGPHSIRISDQWRICFVWRDSHRYDVGIVDYH
jgi:hypothetical protein